MKGTNWLGMGINGWIFGGHGDEDKAKMKTQMFGN